MMGLSTLSIGESDLKPSDRAALMTTIKQVAHHAGVSFKTVSRVLNDDPKVAPATRERVQRAIAELGYRPNVAARHMRTGRSHIIGFITDEIATTPFAVNIIKGAQNQAWQHNRMLLVTNTERDPLIEERAIEMMLERRVDGIIYATMYHRVVTPPRIIREAPTVLLDCFVADRSLPSVVPDEVEGGRIATETLIARGHRRIGFLNVDFERHYPAAAGRLEGYRMALEAHGLPFDDTLVRCGNTMADQGYEHTRELMELPVPPTALFCGTDRTAMGAYDALKELGLRIPEDVAVVGFDNQELIATYLRPALTTIALPHYQMGAWAIQYLVEHPQAQPDNPVQEKVRCPLVERGSV
jgi:LacI family transcriptional regulator